MTLGIFRDLTVSDTSDETFQKRLWDLSYLHNPGWIAEQIKVTEAQLRLRLVNLNLQPNPPTRNLYDVKPEAPSWSEDHHFHWLPAAESGDREAMLQLGIIYYRDNDLSQAEAWYSKAADAGEPEAKDRLEWLHRQQKERATDQ